MSAVRILLLLLMGAVVLVMASCPGLYDSKRRSLAARAYYAAQRQHEAEPSLHTDLALKEALRQMDEAKHADKRTIMLFEVFLALSFGSFALLFFRAGKIEPARGIHRKQS